MRQSVKLFISYAKDNRQQWLLPVRQHLLGLQRVGLIELWEDSRIEPGESWDETIVAALEAADIIILLVSSAFTASEYCHREMTRALEKRKQGTVEVLWIYVDHCDYGAMPFTGLEGMPKDDSGRLQPLIEFNRKAQARHLADASKKVRELAIEIVEANGPRIVTESTANVEATVVDNVNVPESLVARAQAISVQMGVPIEALRSILVEMVRTLA